MAALLDDEDCRAAEVRFQLDCVRTNVSREVLLGDDLAHGVHEHGCTVASLACGEHGANGARLNVYVHLGGGSYACCADGV